MELGYARLFVRVLDATDGVNKRFFIFSNLNRPSIAITIYTNRKVHYKGFYCILFR